MPKNETEYLQERYRPKTWRIESLLNERASEGWRVELIEPKDDLYIVTYSREIPDHVPAPRAETRVRTTKTIVTQSVNFQEFNEDLSAQLREGWNLQHLATSVVPMPPLHTVYYTCVWQKVEKRTV